MADRPRATPRCLLPYWARPASEQVIPVAGRGGRLRPARRRAGIRAIPRLLALLVLAVVAGCGLPAGGPVQEVAVPSVSQGPADAGPRPGWREVAVYFVQDVRLEAVPRQVAEERPQTAVDLLLAGPTQAEVMSGLRTALGPQDVAVLSGPDGSGTAVVAVGREFAGIGGGNQLLAVAQLVWTVTQFPQVDQVCFSLDGVFLEVPTDQGLTDRPVGRTDYRSVAPRPAEVASPSPTTAPTDPPSVAPPGRMAGSVPRRTGDPTLPPR